MSEFELPLHAEALRKLPIFRGVAIADVAPILADCARVRIEPGAVIVAPGEPPHRLYVILDGEVSVRLQSLDAGPVARFGAGEIFGELSVIDGLPASAYVVAESRCRLLGLDRDALWRLFGKSPHVASNLLAILTQRLRASNERIAELERRAPPGGEDDIEDPIPAPDEDARPDAG